MIGSAEFQVVQATLRVDSDRDLAIRTAARRLLDWQRMQRLARFHRVLPLVYERLRAIAPGLVPPGAMQEMAAFRKANELHTFQMTADLVRVVRALEDEGISVLCLKGPMLATLVYGDPALRCFEDLDILVQLSDYPRAEATLTALGFTPVISKIFPASQTTDRAFAVERERHFVFPHRRYCLEMHWRITTRELPRALGPIGLFQRSRRVVVNGQPLSTLGDYDVAMHVCHHGMYHGWKELSYVVDFAAALLAVGPQQWEALLARAREQGLYRPMLVGMRLCHALLGLALSQEIIHACSRDLVARWIASSLQAYYSRSSEWGEFQLFVLIFRLFTVEKGRTRAVLALVSIMFTPTVSDYQRIALPAYLRWLYPVLSLVRRTGEALAAIRGQFR